jgi:glycerophosphoryl diester phosphodiesterase
MMSFDHYSLLRVRELDSNIAICLIMGCLTPAAFPFMKQIGSEYLWMSSYKYLTREYAQECLDNNVQLIANPVDTEDVRRKLLEQYPSALASTNMLEEWRQFYEQNRAVLG